MASSYRIMNGPEGVYGDPSSPIVKRRKLDNIPAVMFRCLVCKEPFRRRADLWEHLTSKELGVIVFVCLDCGRAFCKERLLRTHVCDGADPASINNDQRTALSVFCHVMVCEECGLFVSLVNIENPSWKSYSSLCAHSSRSFRKLTLYTWTSDAIRFIKNDLSIPFNVRIDTGPSVTEGVPLACDKCGVRYTEVDDVEKHVLESHPADFDPIDCDQCDSKFSSPLRMELHVGEKHGRGKWDLIDFLKGMTPENPFLEKPPVNRNDSYYNCDLCGMDFLGDKFNEHDCAVNYMRRYLLNGRVVFCPAVVLTDCKVDMGIQDPMLSSLTKKTLRHVDLCLRFYTPIVAPRIDDFRMDQVFSCQHCERIFISPELFREHVMEIFQEREVDFDWSRVVGNKDPLTYFGSSITIVETGFICPKPGCCTKWCSTVGLERHIRNSHSDTFKALKAPPMLPKFEPQSETEPPPYATESATNIQFAATEHICRICGDRRFQDQVELQGHVYKEHLHPCNSCASCFITGKRLNYHLQWSACKDRLNRPSPTCYCPICNDIFKNLSDFYYHLLVAHPNEASHDGILGEITPKCTVFLQVKEDPTIGATVTPNLSYDRLPRVDPDGEFQATTQSAIVLKQEPNQSFHLNTIGNAALLVSADSSEDNDCQVILISQAKSSEENGVPSGNDDEVAVCEADSGTTSGRKMTHGCTHCSMKFYTLKALDEHLKTHANDAGLITNEVLPVPPNLPIYICRFCCVAFELETDFEEHFSHHRRTNDCQHCSALCLNPVTHAAHLESHQRLTLAFGCATCNKAYRNEIALLLHLNQVHNVALFWFCKLCGLGNSEYRGIAYHSCNGSSVADLPIYATVKRKLHFQPSSTGISKINPHSLDPQDVSPCVHRSFLSTKEACVACTDCGTIMSTTSYSLTPAAKERPELKLRLVDEYSERTLINSHPCARRLKTSLIIPSKTAASKRILMPKEIQIQPRAILPAPPPNATVIAVRPLLPAPQRRATNTVRPILPAPPVPIAPKFAVIRPNMTQRHFY